MKIPTFKELIKGDTGVFLNTEEFGEPHNLNGKTINVMIDNNEMIEREKRGVSESYNNGVFKKQLLFFVKADCFGTLPQIGRTLLFDQSPYLVIDAIDEGGIYSISLEACKS